MHRVDLALRSKVMKGMLLTQWVTLTGPGSPCHRGQAVIGAGRATVVTAILCGRRFTSHG